MTKSERIAHLEARVAQLEAELHRNRFAPYQWPARWWPTTAPYPPMMPYVTYAVSGDRASVISQVSI